MKLLIPVDGSDLSVRAVAHAVRLVCQGLKAELVLINVQESATLYELVALHDAEALAQLARDAGADMLAGAVQVAQGAGVPFVQEVVVGDPVPMLLEAVEEYGCEAVIMGSHGKGVVRSAWLGSVSRELLELSPVPITFVKPLDKATD